MTPADELDALRHAAAAVDRTGAGHVLVTGPDTFSFLQALVSADLDAVGDGEGVRSLLLSPQGKLDVAFRLLRVGDDAWLDCDPGLGPQLAASLGRYRIRVKAEVVDRSGEWGAVSLIGPRAADIPAPTPEAVRVVPTPWGRDFLGPRADVAGVLAALVAGGVPQAGTGAYEAWRIEQGIPRQPLDLDGSTIPQEAFLERDAVSFTKGCFVGQELVCRIDSRGHVNRFLRRLGDVRGDWPPPGAEIVAGGRGVGTLTSVAPRELPTGALGYVRREVEPPAEVVLRWDAGTATATVLS